MPILNKKKNQEILNYKLVLKKIFYTNFLLLLGILKYFIYFLLVNRIQSCKFPDLFFLTIYIVKKELVVAQTVYSVFFIRVNINIFTN